MLIIINRTVEVIINVHILLIIIDLEGVEPDGIEPTTS